MGLVIKAQNDCHDVRGLKLQCIANDTFSSCFIFSLITALHGTQTRSYDENSLRPSVRLSVCPSV